MDDVKVTARKRFSNPVPAEGDNGVFTQSWFPVAWSSDVPKGKVIGREFLDGKIVIFRGENGRAVATSAYCAHVGADLSVGEVVGNNLRCAFHHWEYNQDARLERTGMGVKPPQNACLFRFPTEEHYGIIWVFNGETPLFEIPQFPIPEEDLEIAVAYEPTVLHCDPWVFSANTPDIQHIKVVHKVSFDGEDPHARATWRQYGFRFDYKGIDQGGVPVEYTLGIEGTSIFFRHGNHGGFWRGSVVGFGLPKPGYLVMYSINAVPKGPKAKEQLEMATFLSRRTLSEDKAIMDSLHYRPGYLIDGDQSLAKFLNYIRAYPRAHPSAEFIR